MVQHHIYNNGDAPLVRFVNEGTEKIQGTENRVDVVVVGYIIAEIEKGGRIYRGKPEPPNPQVMEIVELSADTFQVTNPITVGIEKTAGIDLIDWPQLPPGEALIFRWPVG
jgi:hypothetical protein